MVVPKTRVLLTVKVYKELNKKESILSVENVDIEIPSGSYTQSKDWFPMMIWYHDEGGFSQLMGEELDLTVLYAFGDFNSSFGTSSYYDVESSFYGAFYGGYAIKNKDNPKDRFGFNDDNSIAAKELESVPKYDQTYLVLPALGCPAKERVFQSKVINVKDNTTYAGSSGWTRIDTSIYTNGPAHHSDSFNIGYLQYGKPLKPIASNPNFQPQWFLGRMYVKYFEEIEMTIGLYVMCKDEKQLNICDETLLNNTKINLDSI